MNNNENEVLENKVDVPYYTRDLSKDNDFKIKIKPNRASNVSKYRRQLTELVYEKEYYNTKRYNEIDKTAIKIFK